MRRSTFLRGLTVCAAALALAGCGGKKEEPKKAASNTPSPAKTEYVFGIIAKSQANKIFIPVRKGAEDAAKALGAERGLNIRIVWQTPTTEDAKQQAQYLQDLANQCDGVAISVSDANMLEQPINDVVAQGIPVMTFDSDAPGSDRFAYFGTDNYEAGVRLMDELAAAMGEQGVVAILTGSSKPPNLNARVQGVQDALANYPNMSLLRVFDNESEDSKRAVEVMEQAQAANPQITGWAMVGGWALYTDNALDNIRGKAKVASLDAMPSQLPYVERGEVEVLLGQNSYEWGYKSVEMLLARVHDKESPADPVVKSELKRVDGDNLAEYRAELAEWGID